MAKVFTSRLSEGKDWQLPRVEVPRAYLHVPARRRIGIRLQPEARGTLRAVRHTGQVDVWDPRSSEIVGTSLYGGATEGRAEAKDLQ